MKFLINYNQLHSELCKQLYQELETFMEHGIDGLKLYVTLEKKIIEMETKNGETRLKCKIFKNLRPSMVSRLFYLS